MMKKNIYLFSVITFIILAISILILFEHNKKQDEGTAAYSLYVRNQIGGDESKIADFYQLDSGEDDCKLITKEWEKSGYAIYCINNKKSKQKLRNEKKPTHSFYIRNKNGEDEKKIADFYQAYCGEADCKLMMKEWKKDNYISYCVDTKYIKEN